MKNIYILLLSSLLLVTSQSLYAGKIYRFADKNGVSTLSKSLPPYAAQNGYDILDEQSLRLIEHVPTREEVIKQKQQQEQQQKLAEQAEKEEQQRQEEAKRRRVEQLLNDRNLIARYPSEQVLITSRDSDLLYRQNQTDEINERLLSNETKLRRLQAQAAEQEINNGKISANLSKQLAATQKSIENKKQFINRSLEEKELVSQQYEADLVRLRLLLNTKQIKSEN
ncbi:MAG: DUF4124 domain-containing protein [Methylophaga sp.]|nr:DUF4124 domain-containing protein [Methylophaga sp.]